MKKLLLGFIFALTLGLTPTAQASDLSSFINGLGGIINTGGSATNEIRGIIGTGAGIVNDIEEIGCIIDGDCGVTPEGTFELPSPEKFNTVGENVSLRQYILNVLNFVLSFLGLIAVAALVYAGFIYVTSGGDDSANEKSKKIVIYAVIGILLILASFAIVNTVIQNAGQGTDDRNGISNVAPTGGIVTPGTPGTPGTGGNSGIRGLLTNPIVVSGTGVQDSLNSAFVSLADARNGVEVSLSVQALAIVDFGDGFQAVVNTADNPNLALTHAYGEAGQYNITAVVETADGQTGTFRKQLNVGGLTADFQASSTSALVDTPITLNGASSQSQQGTIVAYDWACSNCSISQNGEAATTATFSQAGTFDVTLTVTNSVGQTATATQTINVSGDTPVANFTFQTTGDTSNPSEFQFDASTSSNITGGSNNLTFNWNFNGLSRQTNSPQAVYAFPEAGIAEVTLFVTQNFDGQTLQSETVSQTVDVPSTLDVDFDVY